MPRSLWTSEGRIKYELSACWHCSAFDMAPTLLHAGESFFKKGRDIKDWRSYVHTRQPADTQPALICVFGVPRLPCRLSAAHSVCLCLQQVSSPLYTHKNALKELYTPAESSPETRAHHLTSPQDNGGRGGKETQTCARKIFSFYTMSRAF